MDCEDALIDNPHFALKQTMPPLTNGLSPEAVAIIAGMAKNGTPPAVRETIVQLKLYNSPVTFWKRRFKDRPFRYRISPMDLSRRDSEAVLESYDGQESSNINDLVQDDSSIKIAILQDGSSKPKPQEQFGHSYNPEEYVFFSTSVPDTELMAYMMDFYVDEPGLPIPEHVGFCYVLPSNLRGTSGSCTMPITGKKHQPIGQISIEYLIIKPLSGYEPGDKNFASLWNPTGKKGLDIGHRGAGGARRTDKVENVLENTVASFNYAAAHGADMVELDVQLTKDLVPVIYHDYFINIAMKKKRSAQEHESLQIPINELTLEQLHALKLSPVQKLNKPNYDFMEDDHQDNQPFPTLEHILDVVDKRCGFNVEIKYPMQRVDGTWDASFDKQCDMNDFVDIILRTIFEHARDRKILLSCFHPDVCTMVSLKQTCFPLLFLTQGKTDKWTKYFDPRTRDVQMATYFAISMNLLGIDVHAEDLLKERSLIQFVKNRNLILFIWGDDLMDKSIIKQFKLEGVDGVIYDKIDEFHSKESFIVNSSEDRKTLIDIIAGSNSLEMPGINSSWASSSNISINSEHTP